jgi:hypothetical protein
VPAAPWVLALSLVLQVRPAIAPVPPNSDAPVRPNSEWSDDRPFTHIARNLGTDFSHLANPANAAIIGAGVLAAIAMHRHDAPLSAWAAAQPASSYTKIGNITGDAITQGSLAIGTYAIGKMAHDDEATHIGSDLIRAQLLNGIFTEALKYGVDRRRPTGSPHSFPSGHSSASFATAAVLQNHLGWGVGSAAYAAAGFISWTRLRDDQHWLTDVIVGSAIGIMSGHTVTFGHHKSQQMRIVPSTTPHGGPAVLVVWTGK